MSALALFAAGDLPWTYIAPHEAYRARSVWPAIFFHSFHNMIAQWLFPKFFTVAAGQVWLREESGILPAAGYLIVALVLSAEHRGDVRCSPKTSDERS